MAYPLVFLRFHGGSRTTSGAGTCRAPSRSSDGLAAVVGINDNPSFADWVYFVIEHPAEADHLQGRRRMGASAIGRSVQLRRRLTLRNDEADQALLAGRLWSSLCRGVPSGRRPHRHRRPGSSQRAAGPGGGARSPPSSTSSSTSSRRSRARSSRCRGDTLTLDAGKKHGVHSRARARGATGRAARSSTRGRARSSGERGRARPDPGHLGPGGLLGRDLDRRGVKPGDRFRASSDKVHIVLLPLLGGVREGLVEAATQELVERLGATGRFRVSMGDAINVYLSQEGIKAEDFLQGKGVQQAAQRFKVENLLAVHFKRVQGKPYMEVRFYAFPQHGPADQHRRSSCRRPSDRRRRSGRPVLRRAVGRRIRPRPSSGRSWPGCSGATSRPAPTRAARAPFPCARSPGSPSRSWPWTWRWRRRDRIPRLAVSDGDHVYMYKIIEQRMEPEWTKSVRLLGRTISVQLADLDGDGVLEVVGNRYNRKGRPQLLRAHGQERQAHDPGGEHRRFPLRRRPQGRRRQADAVDAAVQQDGVLHSRARRTR